METVSHGAYAGRMDTEKPQEGGRHASVPPALIDFYYAGGFFPRRPTRSMADDEKYTAIDHAELCAWHLVDGSTQSTVRLHLAEKHARLMVRHRENESAIRQWLRKSRP
jgi:hypothetical protein